MLTWPQIKGVRVIILGDFSLSHYVFKKKNPTIHAAKDIT